MSDVTFTVVPIDRSIAFSVVPPDTVPIALTAPGQTQTIALTIGPQIGRQGPKGDKGDKGDDGVDYDPATSWISLLAGGTSGEDIPITGGVVTPYNYGTTTYYRFSADDDSIDAFYTTFNGTAVSGLVCTKALNF